MSATRASLVVSAYRADMLATVPIILLLVCWLNLAVCFVTGRWLMPPAMIPAVPRPATPGDVRRESAASGLLLVATTQLVLARPSSGLLDPSIWLHLLSFATCVAAFVLLSSSVQRTSRERARADLASPGSQS